MFYGFESFNHLQRMVGPELANQLRSRATTKDSLACTRGRGPASWYPPDDQGRERFSYRNGGEPDYGCTIRTFVATYKKHQYGWSDPIEEE